MSLETQVSVYFPDYTVIRGKNASEVLLKVGKKQWKFENRLDAIKRMLSKRASHWSGAEIDPNLPAPEFLTALGESGMVFVWFGPEDPFIGVPNDS
jgi:hypothetical protein